MASILQLLERTLGKSRFYKAALNFYPPYVGAGIRVEHVGKQLESFDIAMDLRPFNRNYVGTHFGGSLYSMCDPFYMLILMEKLGSAYEVWDKAATIRFRKPGRGKVRARFAVTDEEIAEIRRNVATEGRYDAKFATIIADKDGDIVAQLDKTVHIRMRPAQKA